MRAMHRISLLVSLLVPVLATSCKRSRQTRPNPDATSAASAAPAHDGVDLDDLAGCKQCHPAVVAEWEQSRHAGAHPGGDPVVAAMLAFRTPRDGADLGQLCAGCHQPRRADAGVTCATCHTAAEVAASGAGVARLVSGPPGMLFGPRGEPSSAATHGIGATPAHFGASDGQTLCLACHETLVNAAGVAACSTGPEMMASAAARPDGGGSAAGEAASERRCVACHMPTSPGGATLGVIRAEHRSHRFIGAHTRWSATPEGALPPLALRGRFERGEVVVTLENLAPHAFPTGFPARVAVLALVGLDAKGAEVWKNFDKDPLSEAPWAVLNKGYVDAEGKPTIAPWAAKLVRDTRLTGGERRDLRAQVPAQVTSVRARVVYRLVAPFLADKLKLAEHPLAQPRPLVELSIPRKP